MKNSSAVIIISLVFFANATLQSVAPVQVQDVKKNNDLFTASIYREALKESQGNLIVSPFSLNTILSLTQAGAIDETGKEIRSALKLPEEQQNEIAISYRDLMENLKNSDNYHLHIANKLYAKNGAEIKPEFKKIAEDAYYAGIENANFGNGVEAASVMNNWVAEQTGGKIKDMIEASKLDEKTYLVLLNAVYFKGNWTKNFDYSDKQVFFKAPKEEIVVDTMHKTDFYNYHDSAELDASFLEIPFSGGNVSMVIALPHTVDGLSNLENHLEEVLAPMPFIENVVGVSLPKFKVDSKILFNRMLINLGITKAFGEDADFSGIAGNKGELSISDVLQKAFVDVNESGVEAAASTLVGIVLRDGIETTNRRIFQVDRPFLFYIKVKDSIVFVGRVTEPKY